MNNGQERTGNLLNRETLPELMNREFSAGRAFSLTVTGSSMEPFLRNLRDQVILVSLKDRPPGRGEIVLFRREDGSFVLHRILLMEKNGICVMNGDAQTWTEKIHKEQIDAVAAGVVRRGRYISCDSLIYRLFVRVWSRMRPWRRLYFEIGGCVKRLGKDRGNR